MPETTPTSKVFTYQGDGLSYTITVTQGTDGTFTARLEVTEGQADINAVYWGDDDMSGRSTSLPGALNMNGGGSQFEGEPVQWDGALKLSDPGLGRAGVDKTTFLQEGEALEFDLPISSFDDIAFIGIRATSTSTPEGSIKGVTPGTDIVDDDDNDDDDDCDDDCDVCDTPVRDDYPTLPDGTTGVTFGVDILGEGEINEFIYVTREEATVSDDTAPTFADYVAVLDARFEADGQPCEAEPLKALIYVDNNPEHADVYEFVEGPFVINLLPKAQDDLLPTVPVEDEDMVMEEDEDEEVFEIA